MIFFVYKLTGSVGATSQSVLSEVEGGVEGMTSI